MTDIKPCGGCGEINPSKRCLGCHHDFGDKSSEWIKKISDRHKEVLERLTNR